MQIATTHKNTDFDALASTICATILYPGTIPVLPGTINPNIKDFLSIHKDVLGVSSPSSLDLAEVKRMIVVDTNSWYRLDRMEKLKKNDGLEIILWDHHENEGDIEADWECREKAGATITLMMRKLKEDRKTPTPIQATLFLAGIYEDTGHLMFPSTGAEDAYAAAYLLEHKADLGILNKFLRPAYGEKQKDILFTMLKTANRTKIKDYDVSIVKMEINGHVNNLSVVVNMYREILNVDTAFGIFSGKDRCIVIGRSNSDGVDMSMIMRSMGGGGHQGAGSAMLKSAKSDAVENMIRDLIEGNQQASVQISDLMSFPVFYVRPETTMEEVAVLLEEKGCTGVPVIDDKKITGILSRRDFNKIKKNKNGLKSPAKAFMSTKVMTISPGKSPMYAARLMVKHDIGRLPVVDKGEIIGIITRSDAMTYFYDLLPG